MEALLFCKLGAEGGVEPVAERLVSVLLLRLSGEPGVFDRYKHIKQCFVFPVFLRLLQLAQQGQYLLSLAGSAGENPVFQCFLPFSLLSWRDKGEKILY